MKNLGTIDVAEISRAYAPLGVDVRSYFTGAKTTLIEQDLGYYKFSDCRPGDPGFYGTLMREMGGYPAGKWEYRSAAELIGADDSVLDIGCGEGLFEEYCRHFKGIDLNEQAIRDGRAKGRRVFLEELADQPEGAFDVVTLFEVLEHVEDPVGFLKRAVSALKPGGRLIVCVPDMDGTIGQTHNVQLNYPPHHMTWWSEAALRNIAEACGATAREFRREPLQRIHFSVGFFAWFHPRTSAHFDNSPRARALWFAARVLARLVPRRIAEVPFINGQVILMAATKAR